VRFSQILAGRVEAKVAGAHDGVKMARGGAGVYDGVRSADG